MTLEIFKNEDDYNKVVMNGGSADYYVTSLNGYDYVMNGPNPFRYLNGLNEKREINPMDIDKVIRTRDTVIVILNLDSMASENVTWDEILSD